VCSRSNRLLNFSNCFCFETYLGSLRLTTFGGGSGGVVGSSSEPKELEVLELGIIRQLAAAATEDRGPHERGMKLVKV